MKVKLSPLLGAKSPVAAVVYKTLQVVSVDSSATVMFVAVVAVLLAWNDKIPQREPLWGLLGLRRRLPGANNGEPVQNTHLVELFERSPDPVFLEVFLLANTVRVPD